MKLKVVRENLTTSSTIGKLYVDDVLECYTLEDVDRKLETVPADVAKDMKVKSETAIPAGVYKVVKRYSPKFNTITPHILGVPNFEYILIHWGNTAKDTDGCILVGDVIGDNTVLKSRVAFNRLMTKINTASEITIEIITKEPVKTEVKETIKTATIKPAGKV